MTKPRFFTEEEEAIIVKAIQEAEKMSSGEIKVHVERHTQKDNFARAREVFESLGMTKTEDRNGVLFYMAIEDHKFSILGDKGIHEKCPKGFWDEIRNEVQDNFKAGKFVEGLCTGISKAGKALKEYFPHAPEQGNQLSDQISRS